jgi:hypothetical protein
MTLTDHCPPLAVASRLLPLLALLCLPQAAAALPVAPAEGAPAAASLVTDQAGATLEVEDQDRTYGVVDGELQVLINLQPYQDQLAALSPEDAAALLTRSAVHYAGEILAEPENAGVEKARVDLIGLSDLNEYGNADLSTVDKFGFVRLAKAADKLEVVENTVSYKPAAK